MKKLCILKGLAGGAVCLFSACTVPMQTVSIDELHPAEYTVPKEVRTVAVVDNSVADSLYYHPLRHYEGRAYEDRNTFLLPLGGYRTVKAFAQNLADTRYFSKVILADSALSIRPEGYLYTKKDTLGRYVLDQAQVDSLAGTLGADMLVTYDYGQAAVKVMPQVGYADATLSSVFRLYLPGRRDPLYTFTDKDTIYWNDVKRLTLEEAKNTSAEVIAENPLKRFVPQWKSAGRVYFSAGNKYLKAAVPLVLKNDWMGAFKQWQKAYEEKNLSVKMRAAFNAALFFEIQGNLKEAVSWCDVAWQLTDEEDHRDRSLIESYKKVLLRKQQMDGRLNRQMNR